MKSYRDRYNTYIITIILALVQVDATDKWLDWEESRRLSWLGRVEGNETLLTDIVKQVLSNIIIQSHFAITSLKIQAAKS